MLDHVKSRQDLHLPRKLFHFVTIFTIFLLMVNLPKEDAWFLYFLFAIPGILFDLTRINFPSVNRFAVRVMGGIIRKTELRRLSGASYAALGLGFVFYLFPAPIAQLSALFLAVGDPMASLVGILFGKRKILGDKTLEGFLGGFVFCTIAAYGFFAILHHEVVDPLVMAIGSGLFAALAELVPVGNLDDNLVQPIASAILVSVFFAMMGAQLW